MNPGDEIQEETQLSLGLELTQSPPASPPPKREPNNNRTGTLDSKALPALNSPHMPDSQEIEFIDITTDEEEEVALDEDAGWLQKKQATSSSSIKKKGRKIPKKEAKEVQGSARKGKKGQNRLSLTSSSKTKKWTCSVCTFIHEGKKAEMLNCEMCGTTNE